MIHCVEFWQVFGKLPKIVCNKSQLPMPNGGWQASAIRQLGIYQSRSAANAKAKAATHETRPLLFRPIGHNVTWKNVGSITWTCHLLTYKVISVAHHVLTVLNLFMVHKTHQYPLLLHPKSSQIQQCQVARNFMDQPVDLHKPEPPWEGGVRAVSQRDTTTMRPRQIPQPCICAGWRCIKTYIHLGSFRWFQVLHSCTNQQKTLMIWIDGWFNKSG